MRVEVDEAWRDDQRARVDLPCRSGVRQSSNGRDAAAADPDVGGERRIARPIDDAPAADQEVIGWLLGADRQPSQSRDNEDGNKPKCLRHVNPHMSALLPGWPRE